MITQCKTAAMKSNNEEIISLNFKAAETCVTIYFEQNTAYTYSHTCIGTYEHIIICVNMIMILKTHANNYLDIYQNSMVIPSFSKVKS